MRIVRVLWKIVLVLLVIVAVTGLLVYWLSQRRIDRVYQVSVPSITVPDTAESVARGKRLVTVVAPCGDCHGEDFGGKLMINEAPMGTLHAANLTRGRGGIAASYSNEDWVRAMMHGVRKDGRSVVFMPSHDFRFTERDLADMIAFFRSLPPVNREPPPPRIGPVARALSFGSFPLLPAELIDHEKVDFAEPPPPTADLAVTGQHLLDTAGCRGCHLPDLSGGGGPPPGGSNITPVGIGDWSDDDFLKAIRAHVRPNGTKISDSMPPAYGQMTDEELKAIHAYLKTVAPTGKKSKSQEGPQAE